MIMKKPILITLLCTCLMLVTPLVGVAQENKISNNPSEQPDIDGLVSHLRVVIDEILEKATRYGQGEDPPRQGLHHQ